MKKITLISLFIFFANFANVKVTIKPVDATHKKAFIHFALNEDELLYQHSLGISVDSPYITLGTINEEPRPLEKYDPVTKKTALVFQNNVTLSAELTKVNEKPINAVLHVTYQTNQDSHPNTELFPLNFSSDVAEQSNATQNHVSNVESIPTQAKKESIFSFISHWLQGTSQHISTLVEQTKSFPIRLIFVFLLGILLSFTPCIYPMIPITVGVLQAQQSSSVLHNFGKSFAYTLGLSMTFACFGLAASITGPIYGKLLMSPIPVGILVLVLSFLGFSMFGLYDVQLPKFLQFKKESKGGSLLSTFLFGAASGTIASPCVSPGLILLLSVVATLGNMFHGFLLLFSFGFGLSVPLLLIGTFSSSINMMPRAGMWMVEVKKFFGILLFGVCFYYLSNVLNHTILMYLISFTLLLLGIYYLVAASKSMSPGIKKFCNVFGFTLVVSSVISLGYTLQSHYLISPEISADFWLTDYQEGLKKARQEKKLLFLDFWAEYCSICKAINKKLSNDPEIITMLKSMVPVKINGTYDEKPFSDLKKQYNIVGFPLFLVIDPRSGTVLKKWHSELYALPKEQLLAELRALQQSLK